MANRVSTYKALYINDLSENIMLPATYVSLKSNY